MKKNLLFVMLMLVAVVTHAQYSFSGTVLTTTGAPVVGQTVYIHTDSLKWNSSMGPLVWITAVTNSSGAYTATLPSTTVSGHPLFATTSNCSGPWLQNSHTYAGVNITGSNFTRCVPPPAKTISGMVTIGSSAAVGAKVMLIEQYPDSNLSGLTTKLFAVDSAITNSSGNYTIATPTSAPHGGTMLVKAFLLSSHASYWSYLPTYYTSSAIWSGGTTVGITSSVTANIALISGTNPGGPGFIGGDVAVGANKTTAVGDPLPNRQIILTNGSGAAVAYTFSDANGKFSFSNVPYGTYQILGDVGGKTSTPLTFSVSAANPTVNNIYFEEKNQTFNAKLVPTGVGNVNANINAIVAYPNPAKDVVFVSGLDAIQGSKTVTLADVTGKQIYNHTFAANEAAAINVQSLNSGLYMMQVVTNEGTVNLKITK
ncbi:MAG: carboxypeptidase regulatory-like domain-containing protein [Bacteroidetes bacterium]|nr:carboxypeptidase regulatory-like domain-containing protein [Bacteroidota bacterium]